MARVLSKLILYGAVMLYKDLRVKGVPKLTLFPGLFMQRNEGGGGRAPLRYVAVDNGSSLCVTGYASPSAFQPLLALSPAGRGQSRARRSEYNIAAITAALP